MIEAAIEILEEKPIDFIKCNHVIKMGYIKDFTRFYAAMTIFEFQQDYQQM